MASSGLIYIHQKKPCQVDWQKLVLPVKIDLVEEKFSFLMYIKQDEQSTSLYTQGGFLAQKIPTKKDTTWSVPIVF